MSFVSEYVDLLIKQYHEKTNASAEIGLLAETWEKTFNFLKSFEEEFDIDSAIGAQLDIIGRMVGVSRSVPGVLLKIFYGFDDVSNTTGMDSKFEEVGDLGGFFSKDSEQYTTLQLSDNDYRFFIKAKIARNTSRGMIAYNDDMSIQEAVNILFDGLAYISDNKDMSMTLYISTLVDEERTRLILQLDLIPRPQGVEIFLVVVDFDDFFGFFDNTNSEGFKDRFDAVTYPGGHFAEKSI